MATVWEKMEALRQAIYRAEERNKDDLFYNSVQGRVNHLHLQVLNAVLLAKDGDEAELDKLLEKYTPTEQPVPTPQQMRKP